LNARPTHFASVRGPKTLSSRGTSLIQESWISDVSPVADVSMGQILNYECVDNARTGSFERQAFGQLLEWATGSLKR
jgi:hypothetical protein